MPGLPLNWFTHGDVRLLSHSPTRRRGGRGGGGYIALSLVLLQELTAAFAVSLIVRPNPVHPTAASPPWSMDWHVLCVLSYYSHNIAFFARLVQRKKNYSSFFPELSALAKRLSVCATRPVACQDAPGSYSLHFRTFRALRNWQVRTESRVNYSSLFCQESERLLLIASNNRGFPVFRK